MANIFNSDDIAAMDMSSGSSPVYELPVDIIDAQKVAVVTGGDTVPWWQKMIQTGFSKVIDNQLTKPQAAGTISPGTSAGQNGQTYQMTSTPTEPTAGASKVAKTDYMPYVLAAAVGLGILALVR